MMKSEYLIDALISEDNQLANAKLTHKQNKKLLKMKAKLAQELEYKSGVELYKTQWQFQSDCQTFEVTLAQLGKIKRVIGNLEDAGKDLAYDFEKTNELMIQLQPIAEKWSGFLFSYRRPLLASDDCKAETVECKTSTYQRLVCPT